jgi:hypothetical protein
LSFRYLPKANVGHNTLNKFLKDAQKAAGPALAGLNITNHSARVTSANRLHEQGFSDQTIREQTGHQSDCYQRYIRDDVEDAIVWADALCAMPVARLEAPPLAIRVEAPELRRSVGASALQPVAVVEPAADGMVEVPPIVLDVAAAPTLVPGIVYGGNSNAGTSDAEAMLSRAPFTFNSLSNCTFNIGRF